MRRFTGRIVAVPKRADPLTSFSTWIATQTAVDAAINATGKPPKTPKILTCPSCGNQYGSKGVHRCQARRH
jgi:hypothetical protein